MKVLHLTYRVPFPATDGGAIAIYNTIVGLAENGCEIDLVVLRTPKHDYTTGSMCTFVKNEYSIFVDTTIRPLRLLKNLLFSKVPYNVERFISDDVKALLSELLTANSYDFIQIESAFGAPYINHIKQLTNTPVIVRTHNVEAQIWKRLAMNKGNFLKKWYFKHLSKRLFQYEKEVYNQADAIASISEDDASLMRKMGVVKYIETIPAGIIFPVIDENVTPQKNSLFILSSLDWQPNIEGLKWFLDNVWPLIVNKHPYVHLHIAGKSTPNWLVESSIPNTTIHGFVENATKFRQSYDLMLVPLLSGGGMRIKIVEGMAAKKCIVSTTIGAEGIPYSKNNNILIADTPEEWVSVIEKCLADTSLVDNIASEAYNFAMQTYDNTKISRKYIDLYHTIK